MQATRRSNFRCAFAAAEAEARLGLIDNLQDGEWAVPYTPRTVVVGGNTPFAISILGGSLPAGLAIGADDGVLSGTPSQGGSFAFTFQATDAHNVTVSKAYTMKVAGSAFTGWSGACAGTGACSTTMSADKAVPVLGNRNVQALGN